MIILIDNYDSFVYNLYQFIGKFTSEIVVFRNDEITMSEIKKLNPKGIVISPGPGRPEKAGISLDIVKNGSLDIPILGVCLGHQVIALAYGCIIEKNKEIVHGKTSVVTHSGDKLFQGIPKGFKVMRYHSLVINRESLNEDLKVIGELGDGTIMAIKAEKSNIYGVQFHPESIGTDTGVLIIRNFLKEICHEC